MASTYHVGQRVSFESILCTVRYIGPVAGTQNEWLGVEWDDSSRGKHDGEHQGVRYFTCKSRSKTAASFVRPSRTADPTQSFVEAVHYKYASEVIERQNALVLEKQIRISGKLVEEVGFDKIRQQLAQLRELKIVLVDGLRITTAIHPGEQISEICPKIVELDLSRNLFESFIVVMRICQELDHLTSLRLNYNRFALAPGNSNLADFRRAFVRIEDLSLDGILLDWEEICLLVEAVPNITTLSANSNELEFIRDSPAALRSISMSMSKLTSLKLEYNEFTCLGDLWPLAQLHSLERLHLGGNRIKTITNGKGVKPVFGKQLQCVDISYNNVIDWDFVDQLPDVFPGITALRISHNPIYGNSASNIEEYYMLTLARIANLKTLNFCHITPAERTNAEIFYLYRIGQAMAAVTANEKHNIIAQHRRFKELCKIHEPPTVTRANSTINPGFLEGRLINFTFYMPLKMRSDPESKLVKMQEIPKGFDIYQVKGIVGKLFSVKPLGLRLIWETGEWDPVAGYEDERESSSEDEDHDKGFDLDNLQQEASRRNGKWIRREVELEDGTRQVGFWIDGMEAKVRVELR